MCGDQICPIGKVCAGINCVDLSVATACQRGGEGDPCVVAELGEGVCQSGFCIVGRCGDGIINAIDECDGENLDNQSCLNYGATFAEGLACDAECSFDTSGCEAICGDGIRHEREECDGADFGEDSCVSKGFYVGELVCTQDCKINVGGCAGSCGDGSRNGFEPCDGIDFGGDSCELRGYLGMVAPLVCTDQCAFAAASCSCGDVLCTQRTQRCRIVNGIPTCGPA